MSQIIAVVRHFVLPNMVAVARRRIDAMGKRMAAMPGFLFRHALVSSDDSHLLVTLTGWQSRKHYEDWVERQRADSSPIAQATKTPYARVDTEILNVCRSRSALVG